LAVCTAHCRTREVFASGSARVKALAGHVGCRPSKRNFRRRLLNPQENTQMKGIGLWLLGVPVIVIIALYVFGIL
jgi:hypothetical protein